MARPGANTPVDRAVEKEVVVWAKNSSRALSNISFPKIEDEGDPFLKTCAWMSFGVDTGRAMYSGFDTVMKKVSEKYVLPIFIFGQVQSAYAEIVKRNLADHNALLNKKYSDLRDEFLNQVDVKAAAFRSTPYGRSMTQDLNKFVQQLRITNEKDETTYTQLLIKQTGLIENDVGTLRKHANRGFGNLCKKIYAIYLGCDRGPGWNNKLVIQGNTLYARASGAHSRDEFEVSRKEDQEKILAEAWRYDVIYHKDRGFRDRGPDETAVRLISTDAKPPHMSLTRKYRKVDWALAHERTRAQFKKETSRELPTSVNPKHFRQIPRNRSGHLRGQLA